MLVEEFLIKETLLLAWVCQVPFTRPISGLEILGGTNPPFFLALACYTGIWNLVLWVGCLVLGPLFFGQRPKRNIYYIYLSTYSSNQFERRKFERCVHRLS
jgi:hypothetical protein